MNTRITQGAFSFIYDLNDSQLRKQIDYILKNGWAIGIEYTDDPHPRNAYWELWGLPMFDKTDTGAIMLEVDEVRKSHGEKYIKINAFNNARGIESTALSFLIHRPKSEPGFYLERQESEGRNIRYTIKSYSVEGNPTDNRYTLW
jgi:ribulose-bisphosphate carboxylase small chain